MKKVKRVVGKPLQIFVICPVREPEWYDEIEAHVAELEARGHRVHWPPRDTNQHTVNGGLDICQRNAAAIGAADEVHIFYNGKSQGTHFDMGVAFALSKKIKVVKSAPAPEGAPKSFQQMLANWAAVYAQLNES